jgi:hypothetical protein
MQGPEVEDDDDQPEDGDDEDENDGGDESETLGDLARMDNGVTYAVLTDVLTPTPIPVSRPFPSHAPRGSSELEAVLAMTALSRSISPTTQARYSGADGVSRSSAIWKSRVVGGGLGCGFAFSAEHVGDGAGALMFRR